LAAPSVASLSGEAQTAAMKEALPSGPVTLERAVEIALRRNHGLVMARQEREIAEGQITEARSASLPTVGLRGTYMRMDRITTFGGSPSYDLPVTNGGVPTGDVVTMLGTPAFELSSYDNYAAVVTLQQPVYLGGRAFAARRIAKAHRAAVENQIAAAEQGTVLAVYKGFYDVLLAREDVKAANEARDFARKNVEDVGHRLEQGMATRFDLQRAKVQLAMSQTGVIVAGNAEDQARASLLTLLGMPPGEKVEIAGALEFAQVDVPGADAAEAALAKRPDLAAQDKLVAMQRENIKIARADALPSVLVTGETGWEDPSQMSFGSLEDDTYWRAGIVLNMTLFDGLRIKGRLRQERARLAQLTTGRQQLVDRIRLEVEQARLALINAGKAVASQAEALEQAREAFSLAQAAYAQGVGTQLDVLGAQVGVTEARRGRARSVYGYVMASVALQRALGTLRPAAPEGKR
jgi:outer membrane protein TolC